MRVFFAAGLIAGLIGVAGLIGMAGQAVAQDWFDPASCAVTADAMAQAEMPPALAATVAAAVKNVPNPRGRLWKITTASGEVSHLWGTYHTPDPLILDLPPEFRRLLDDARVVALEFDPMPDSREIAVANASTGWMWATGTTTDWDFVPPKVMVWIKARLDAIGWGSGYLDQMSVGGLASLLLGDLCSDFLSGVLPGQDGYIAQQAFLAGAEVTGLQQWSDFGVEMNDPRRGEAARAVIVLYGSYLGPGEGSGNSRALAFRLYTEGRMAELDLSSGSFLDKLHGPVEAARLQAQTEGYLVVERNVIFVAAAMPLIEEGGAVIAVGAGHLAGKTGLVEMLRAEGLAVERVVLPGEAP